MPVIYCLYNANPVRKNGRGAAVKTAVISFIFHLKNKKKREKVLILEEIFLIRQEAGSL
jgi:hypothetical protein